MKFTALLIVGMLCASVSAAELFYEDFEDPGNVQVTVSPDFIVADGYLKPTITFSSSTSVLDGTYPASAQDPIKTEVTFNSQNCIGPWESIKIAIGHDGDEVTTDGLVIQWSPLITPTYAGPYLQVQGMVNNQWQANESFYTYPTGTGVGPANYNPNHDYVLTVIDYGDTLDISVHEAADPSNIGMATGIDISAYSRKGDFVATGAARAWQSECEIGIADIRVSSLTPAQPVASIDEGDGVVVTEAAGPAHSDTYVINILEAPPANNDVDGVEGVSLGIAFDGNEICIDPNLNDNPVIFTAANWQTPVTITVTAKDDPNANGDRSTDIVHSLTVLDLDDIIDPNSGYNDPEPVIIESDTVTATVLDDELRYEVKIDEGDGLAVSEQGPTADSYTVELLRPPTITVNVEINTDGQTTTNPTSLNFDNGNWNVPQTVTVTAVDDGVGEDDPHNGSITHAIPVTTGGWNSLFLDTFDASGPWADLIPGSPNASEVGGEMTVPGSTWAVSPTDAPAGAYRARARFSFLGTLFDQGEMLIRGNGTSSGYNGRQPGLRVGYWNGGGPLNSLSIYDVDNLGNIWTQLAFDGGPVPAFDENKQYDMIVEDYGSLVIATLTEVGNPANTTSATLANASGFGYGNVVALGASEDIGDTISFEEFEIEEPTVAPSPEELNWAGAPVVSDPTAAIADNDCTPERATLSADEDQDCDVDLFDFGLWAAQFLGCTLPHVPGCI